MRHKYIFATFVRAWSKSFMSVMALMIKAILYPGAKLFTVAGGKEQSAQILAGKVDELGLNCVLAIEGKDHSIAETIVQNTASKDQKVLTLDSMQSTTAADIRNGASYLSVMEKNLEVLKDALK